MSSRLVRDRYGRLVVEVTVPRLPGEAAGDRMLVLGNSFEAGGCGVGFLGEPASLLEEHRIRFERACARAEDELASLGQAA